MSESTQNNELSILDKNELIKNVITKHKRLLEEYNKEFSGLEEKVKALNEKIESSKKDKEDVLSRTELLKEKRQQLYHQAENILEEMFDIIDEKLLDNKLMHGINDDITKVKRAINIDEEKKIVDELLNKLNGMGTHEDVQKAVQQIRTRVNEAIISSTELASIFGTEKNFENAFQKARDELKEVSPRHGWLDNRIKSHNEALEYWEKLPSSEENTQEANA
ncbi:hypothetical protein SAMN04488587_2110 [Methanococcoides vulcani]|uniref:Uncharacterized protein n=1 Tax=Methanococcoides vulcani TaxID=1353158 RepID=A0A1I0BG46_9EURY|nr:hypothetical protein [Methanococcoides vulcani]SET05162.1 hypothetical protein SAMN04488587_2110 [Methanococcoides vulcani]